MSKKITIDTAIKRRTKGITPMTKEKHSYDGFAVRRSRHSHSFLRYEGAGEKRYPAVPSGTTRFREAESLAILSLEGLDAILQDPKSWRSADGKKSLTKKSQLAITELGFTVKLRAQ